MEPVWRMWHRLAPRSELIRHPALGRTAVVAGLILALTVGVSRTARQSDVVLLRPDAATDTASDTGVGALPAVALSPTPSARAGRLTARSSTPVTTSTRADGVTARFERLVVFDGVMLARLSLRNAGTAPQGWQVVLRFGPDVRSLSGTWTDGTGLSTAQSGRTFVITGTRALAAGGRGEIWMRFGTAERRPADLAPTRCTVNGRPCTGG